jgi:hypothetical protein
MLILPDTHSRLVNDDELLHIDFMCVRAVMDHNHSGIVNVSYGARMQRQALPERFTTR